MRVNLGCGERKLDGYVNVDVCGNPDVRVDLSTFPWPFEDSSVDEVFSEHFLEHVNDFEKTILEMHRILKHGGLLRFKVPHFKSPYYPWHLHLNQFSAVTCLRLQDTYPYLFNGRQLFSDVRVRFDFFVFRPMRDILRFFANISPTKWEWLGLPVDEVETCARKS